MQSNRIGKRDAFTKEEIKAWHPEQTKYCTWRYKPAPGVEVLRHFYTDIVVIDHNKNTITITSGGHHSKTTRDRIRHALPYGILFQKNWEWYIDIPLTDDVHVTIDYKDGLELPLHRSDIITQAKDGVFGEATKLKLLYSGEVTA